MVKNVTFNCILAKEYFIGKNVIKSFNGKNGEIRNAPALWFTNIKGLDKEVPEFNGQFKDGEYKKIINYNAINVGSLKTIPKDYDGIMGVPVTYIKYYHLIKDYEILGASLSLKGQGNDLDFFEGLPFAHFKFLNPDGNSENANFRYRHHNVYVEGKLKDNSYYEAPDGFQFHNTYNKVFIRKIS